MSGEHAEAIEKVPSMAGSSPRERGAPQTFSLVGLLDRIIPA